MGNIISRAALLVACAALALCALGCSSGAPGSAGSAASAVSASDEKSFESTAVSDVGASSSAQASSSKDASASAPAPSASSSSAASSASSAAGQPVVESGALVQASADIQAVAGSAGMDVCVAAIDLQSGEYVGYRGSETMASASMIKMLVAHAFLGKVKQGAFSLQGTYVLQSSDIVGGTGTLAGRGAGAAVTYAELLDKMISVSDNTAANVLIDACGGMDAVNADARALGLAATQLNRYMMDSAAMAAGIENYVSADDLAILFKMIWNGNFVDAESSALVKAALEGQQDVGGVLNGLPSGVPFAHKTGSLTTVRHDGGIVEGPHPYVLVVLCGGDGFYEQGALSAMARVAEATYDDIAT